MATRHDVVMAVAAATKRICGDARTLVQTSDFQQIHEELRASSRGRVTRENDWQLHDLTERNAFGLVVRNRDDGRLAAYCQMRLIDLGSESYAKFLGRQYSRLYGNGDPVLDESTLPVRLNEMKGRVCHMGDFEIFREGRSAPGINSTDLMTVLYGLGVLEFDPDWLFGWLKERSTRRGLAASYLAAEQHLYAIRWLREIPGRKDSDVFMCISRTDLMRLFETARRIHFRSLSEPIVARST